MSVSSTTRKAGPFTGDGVNVAFPFTFKVFQGSDVLVVLTDTNGNDTTQTLTSQYTVSLNANQDANPGGTVTMVSAPAAGYKLTLASQVPYSQATVLTNTGGFFPTVINDALDKVTILIQQLLESIGRTLKVSISTPAGVSTSLPAPLASTVIGWNANANALINFDPTVLASTVQFSNWQYNTFTGDGATTAFTLSANPVLAANMDVSMTGVTQVPGTDFTVSGTTLTFAVAPPNGVKILARYGSAAQQAAVGQTTEYQTATAGQTVFTVSTAFIMGTNALAVFMNGARLTPVEDYTETTTTSITLTSGATAGDRLLFVIGSTANVNSVLATAVAYTPAAGSATDVQTRLRYLDSLTVSVKDPRFGAVGDGVTDDTAAIQAAITAVSVAGGGTLTFPHGTYKVTSTLTAAANVRLLGSVGFQSGPVTIAATHSGNIISVPNAATQFAAEGLAFQGLTTSASLIYVDAPSFAFRHCSFNFSAASAIQTTGNTVAGQVDHCFGMNLVYSRSSVLAPIGGLHILGTDHYITNNEFNCASGQTGTVSANAYVCSIYLGGANHFVTDNIGEFGETGIYVDCAKSRFTGNRADRCMGNGWVIAGSSNVFAANHAIQCGTTTANTYDGFRVTGNLNRFSACGVPFVGVSTLRYGWNDQIASSTQKNEYVGCSCEENCGTGKFFNFYNGGGFSFGTGWYQFNSGTSLDVSGMNKVYFAYGSPATVTAFTGGVSGQTLTFLSNGAAVTIQTGANIKTVSGANLVMASQTIYEFTYWNGTWYQHS